jgi:hypothetical protein
VSRLRAIAKIRALHTLAKRTDREHEAAAAQAAADELARRYRLTADDTEERDLELMLHMLGVPGDSRRVWPLGLVLVLANFHRVACAVKGPDLYGVIDDPSREQDVLRACEAHRSLRLEVARQGGARRLYGLAFVHGLAEVLKDPYLAPGPGHEAQLGVAMVPSGFLNEASRAAMDEVSQHASAAAEDGAFFDRRHGTAHGQRVGERMLRERRGRTLDAATAQEARARLSEKKGPASP